MKLNQFCIGIESIDPNFTSFQSNHAQKLRTALETLNLCNQAGNVALASSNRDIASRAYTEIVKEYNGAVTGLPVPRYTAVALESFRNSHVALEYVMGVVNDGIDKINSYNNDCYKAIGDAALGLESISDSDPVLAQYCNRYLGNSSNSYYIANESDSDVKGISIWRRAYDWICKKFKQIVSFITNGVMRLVNRIRPVSKKTKNVIKVAADAGITPQNASEKTKEILKDVVERVVEMTDNAWQNDTGLDARNTANLIEKFYSVNECLAMLLTDSETTTRIIYGIDDVISLIRFIPKITSAIETDFKNASGTDDARYKHIADDVTRYVDKILNKSFKQKSNSSGLSISGIFMADFELFRKTTKSKYDKEEFDLLSGAETASSITPKDLEEIPNAPVEINRALKGMESLNKKLSAEKIQLSEYCNKLLALLTEAVALVSNYFVVVSYMVKGIIDYCAFVDALEAAFETVRSMITTVMEDGPDRDAAINDARKNLGLL